MKHGFLELRGQRYGAVVAFGLVGGQAKRLSGQRRDRSRDAHKGAHAQVTDFSARSSSSSIHAIARS